MTAGRIAAALAGQPAPPCEHFGCVQRPRCAASRLACDSFAEFAESGKRIALHFEKAADKPRRLYVPGTCRPTRAMYRALYPGERSA